MHIEIVDDEIRKKVYTFIGDIADVSSDDTAESDYREKHNLHFFILYTNQRPKIYRKSHTFISKHRIVRKES